MNEIHLPEGGMGKCYWI